MRGDPFLIRSAAVICFLPRRCRRCCSGELEDVELLCAGLVGQGEGREIDVRGIPFLISGIVVILFLFQDRFRAECIRQSVVVSNGQMGADGDGDGIGY